MYNPYVKRLMDLCLVVLFLPLLLPILCLLAAVIALSPGGPIFFRQWRIGLHERSFRLWKFRTMLPEKDQYGVLRTPMQRITPLAWWIRRLSLDELPQLWNVVRGEMSLVGPRPLLRGHLRFMTERERCRHTVLPGITGWSQVHAYGTAEPARRLAFDVWYAENISLMTDLQVLMKTVSVVVRRPTAVYDTGYLTLDRREE
jgi:lipopolysaccharide/colanic/teichoic acid biosynthesis glycosyltransferase